MINFLFLLSEFFFNSDDLLTVLFYDEPAILPVLQFREQYFKVDLHPKEWWEKYHEITFFEMFRMRKRSFKVLLESILRNPDSKRLLEKKFHGGNYPIKPDKGLLIFLMYMGTQDTLNSIGHRFKLAPSSIMKVVNLYLYIAVQMKNKLISWPASEVEFLTIKEGFLSYPGVIGALDCTHIKVKVPAVQQDSYMDRYHNHSINLLAICTASELFTYIFVGFPGRAHDARVFSHSALFRNVGENGHRLFPDVQTHLIGDSAFPLKQWLMVPYKGPNLNAVQLNHNKKLSSSRIKIEHAFGRLKSRWARLQFINVYSISKAVEISTAACVLHNFCLLRKDIWENIFDDQGDDWNHEGHIDGAGQAKRDRIAIELYNEL